MTKNDKQISLVKITINHIHYVRVINQANRVCFA